ncbi:MAG: PTS sugar transporter subunit IIC [Lachnospiraceae bacterium]|nr:PTS sugar transporter subunit IIC [Lachnospiraceae bacterium]
MVKKYLNRVFIDGLSGMALGLFSTLIFGTILAQIASFVDGTPGVYLNFIANVAKTITGAGIGVGVASKYKESPLVTVAAAVAGMVGAFPALYQNAATDGYVFVLGKPGEPLGAFIAAYIAIEVGHLVSGRTKLDILITPFLSILSGSMLGILVGQYITMFIKWIGNMVNVNVDKHPIIGGMIVAVLMGMILTLPISSAAIGISMGITGLAAGAATVGCCCQMIGFAVASFKENKTGGLIAQGVGTSMLQVPNIMRRPLIWLPPILASAVLGPVSSAVLKMVSTPEGSGMGSSGLVGQFAAYEAMVAAGTSIPLTMIQIMVMHFLLPGILTFVIAGGFRKAGWIKDGDMALKLD